MPYIGLILRGRWCDIVFLNVHTPTEDKSVYKGAALMRNYSETINGNGVRVVTFPHQKSSCQE
jgi:hypothetical protein